MTRILLMAIAFAVLIPSGVTDPGKHPSPEAIASGKSMTGQSQADARTSAYGTPTRTGGFASAARSGSHGFPATYQPSASQPSGQVGTVLISGKATYYAYHEGQAAAAPALRAAMGAGWRGQRVRVCHGQHCVTVRLTDSETSTRLGALIDLDTRDFAKLAPLAEGRIAVTVEYGGSFIPLPATDSEEGS